MTPPFTSEINKRTILFVQCEEQSDILIDLVYTFTLIQFKQSMSL
jgi:hypothetical protein